MIDGCIKLPNNESLLYPRENIRKLYIRKCYREVFDLILEKINQKKSSFTISGTPGIGKSLFFVYILYRLIKDLPINSLSLKPNLIVYQVGSSFRCFDLQRMNVTVLLRIDAEMFLQKSDTLYIIDGGTSEPQLSKCTTLFISSPSSKSYKEFVKQKSALEWFFPVWTLDELKTCRRYCYPDLSIDVLLERYRIYGGVARFVFNTDSDPMDGALADADAVKGVHKIGMVTSIFYTSHTLLHIIVSSDGTYKFLHVDVASQYVGEKLWQLHAAQMICNLKDMFGGSPSEISRHMFEIYGHLVFSTGGLTLQCKCLEDDKVTDINLHSLEGERILIEKDDIPTTVEAGRYYEPKYDRNFPAIDSFSAQGMFQFTVAPVHPIRGVSMLKKICELYKEQPKLYFVVPSDRFEVFKKQKFKEITGTSEVKSIKGLKQYVISLPVGEELLKRQSSEYR